jgi:hypothetical protein
MKLEVDTQEVTLNNVSNVGEFRIRNSAKAFKILSDGLYSNKIKAIIRELSCNAVDSHVAAGKGDVPFEVHLPFVLEPWFSVRDFGIGLDHDQVTNIYTTYFESTKTNSNDFIGALGLGSKSPFSYTENFTVTAVKDGKKRIYTAFINQNGVPSVARMSETDTDEENGVEVKFSVVNQYDYHSFEHYAQEVFQWFKLRPKITGKIIEIKDVKYRDRDIVPGVHSIDGYDSYAIMGNICYLLNVPEAKKHFGNLEKLLDCGLVIEFNIGELDFAASREELSYVPLTINNIKTKLEAINNNLVSVLANEADKIQNEWARAEFLSVRYGSHLWSAAVTAYVTNTKFELIDITKYHGQKIFKFSKEELEKRGLEITGLYVSPHQSYNLTMDKEHDWQKGTNIMYRSIQVQLPTVFVINDLKTGCGNRAKYHYQQMTDFRGNIYCISSTATLPEDQERCVNSFLKELHNPPVIVKASSLEKPEPKKKTPTANGILKLDRKGTSRYINREDYTWTIDNFVIDDKTIYYYIELSNFEASYLDGSSMDVFGIKADLDSSGYKELSEIQIWGVRKGKIKEIKDLPNWIPFETKAKEIVSKISSDYIEQMMISENIDSTYDKFYNNVKAIVESTSITKLSIDSPFLEQSKIFKKKKIEKNIKSGVLLTICKRFGNQIVIGDVREKLKNAASKIKTRYPMIEYITGAPDIKMVDYINLIDKQEKQND